MRELSVMIPMKDGQFDLQTQQQIAAADKRFETTKRKLTEIGLWSAAARIGG